MIERLKPILPAEVYNELPLVISTFNIDNPVRIAHFIAQAAHESGDFKYKEENLNYSAEGLIKVFPKYFPTLDLAKQYARNPEKIASKVYASRMGNGNELSKEGYKYRGRGVIQLTGKLNYTEFDKVVTDNVLNNPDIVATKYYLQSGAWFWSRNKLNEVADLGVEKEVIVKVTKKINGGTHGLDSRIQLFNKYYQSLLT